MKAFLLFFRRTFQNSKISQTSALLSAKFVQKNDQGTTCHNPTAESESAANQALSVQARQS